VVVQESGIERPKGAREGFDRMDGALFLPFEEGAETVSPGIDVISPMSEITPFGKKFGRSD